MGNRAMLSLGTCCEFESNNCLPVTWLALFDPEDFLTETRHEDSGKYKVATYSTLRPAALQQVELAIDRIKGQTPIWAYLRPLEILRDELRLCSENAPVCLDATQFWTRDVVFEQRISKGSTAFTNMLDSLTGDEQQDLATLNQLINDYNTVPVSSVANLHPEDRMFLMIGTYWGKREDLYSLEYFDES